jgi:hypothetical protein
MATTLAEVVAYQLEVEAEKFVSVNDYIGGELSIRFLGEIHCVFCGKLTQKSYGGGSCYQCLQSLPQNDMCQVKPELCHIERGTCRDSEWGRRYCLAPHKVYLARSSSVKVGITRENPTERRWMDQGAIEGMVIAEVPDRKTSGMIEIALAQHVHDKTDFRKMLRGEVVESNLQEVYESLADHVPMAYQSYLVAEPKSVSIAYPLAEPPQKIKTVSLDKETLIEGTLKGIKGQYLIFEDFVFNVRAHSGYDVEFNGKMGSGFKPAPTPKKEDGPLNLFDFM